MVIMTVRWSFAVAEMDSLDGRDRPSSITSHPEHEIDRSAFKLTGKKNNNFGFCPSLFSHIGYFCAFLNGVFLVITFLNIGHVSCILLYTANNVKMYFIFIFSNKIILRCNVLIFFFFFGNSSSVFLSFLH